MGVTARARVARSDIGALGTGRRIFVRGFGLTSRQVNLALEALLLVSLLTGLGTWAIDLRWARPVTIIHAVSGFSLVLLAPRKVRGPVRAGFKRQRSTRLVSAAFGVLVLGAVALGMVHATGMSHGVGIGSALWVHLLLGFVAVPLGLFHVVTRPVRPGHTDVSRRVFVSAGTVTAVGVTAVGVQEVALRTLGVGGARRAGTGSYEVASFDPTALPVVSWINDQAPVPDDQPQIRVDGQMVPVAAIAARARPLRAVLDCTGGWRSEQDWDVVSLADLMGPGDGRSIQVTSATGYSRLFSRSAAAEVFVCTGVGGRALSQGHGAPLRIVVPGRRGPWWVKWVDRVERSERPSWLQLPFPPT